MRLKGIPIGVDDFKKIIEGNGYFADKSLFIKEVIDDFSDIKLITRPRRFGKTLNLSMLKYFFEKSKMDNSHLFKDLKIWQEDDYYKGEQGRYPVISITLKDVKKSNIHDCMESLKIKIADEFKNHKYILNSDDIDKNDKIEFENIVNKTASNTDYENSLYLLSRLLYHYYDTPVVILIDEYDTPINHAFTRGYFNEVIDMMKGFLGSALKGNIYLKMGVVTGIYRVAKESIFSDMNNLYVCAINNNTFCDKFGFVESEVEEILTYYGLDYKIDEVKNWYNGYIFGDDAVIYNPWSIINYAKDKKLKPYWVNTSSNDLILDILYKTDANTKKKLRLLMENKSIEDVEINTSINFRDIMDVKVLNEEVLWNFLIVSGYLKIKNLRIEGRRTKAEVLIPNEEILTLYEDMIESWFRTDEVSSSVIKPMLKYLVNGEMKEFEEEFKYIVRKTFSYFDTGKKSSENFYHAFTLVLLVSLDGKYRVVSNRESGDGRPDVMIIPKDTTKKAVIIEFKVSEDKEEESMKAAVEAALDQIEETNYSDELIYSDIKDIIKIGIAFCGKVVKLGYK